LATGLAVSVRALRDDFLGLSAPGSAATSEFSRFFFSALADGVTVVNNIATKVTSTIKKRGARFMRVCSEV
jgi:hypothetical protein